MGRPYETAVWDGRMGRLYGTAVWDGCMGRPYGTAVWDGRMGRPYGTASRRTKSSQNAVPEEATEGIRNVE